MAAETMHIKIDVRVDAEEISGEVNDGTGPPRSFLGWLGLIGVLDRLLRVAEAPALTSERDHTPLLGQTTMRATS